jgi:hypothetical protein
MELGDLLAVIVAPVAVLVGKDDLADEGSEGLLVERPERLEGQFGERCEIVLKERVNKHASAPLGLRD